MSVGTDFYECGMKASSLAKIANGADYSYFIYSYFQSNLYFIISMACHYGLLRTYFNEKQEHMSVLVVDNFQKRPLFFIFVFWGYSAA